MRPPTLILLLAITTLLAATPYAKDCPRRGELSTYAVTSPNCGGSVYRVVEADVNGDGRGDYILGCDSAIIVWLRSPVDSTFIEQPPLVSLSQIRCKYIHAVDLNGDGDVDLVASCQAGGNTSPNKRMYVFDNSDGLGTFTTQTLSPTNAGKPLQVKLRDMDGDGDLDIVVAARDDLMLRLYLQTTAVPGTSPTTFGSGSTLIGGLDNRIETFEFGYINDDAFMDVVIGGTSIYVSYGQDGVGSFSPVSTLFTDTGNVYHGIGTFLVDLNQDGLLDVLFTSASFGEFRYHLALNASGPETIFAPDALLSTTPRGSLVQRMDLSGDGILDDFVLSGEGAGTSVAYRFFTDPQGTPALSSNTLTNTVGVHSVLVSDFDLDSDNDIVFANSNSESIEVMFSAAAPSSSTPTFGVATTVSRSGTYIEDVEILDINADQYLDIVFVSRTGYATTLVLGSPDGLDAQNAIDLVFLAQSNSIGISDLNLDGVSDILPWGGISEPQALLASELGADSADIVTQLSVVPGPSGASPAFLAIDPDWSLRKGAFGDCDADGWTDVVFGVGPTTDLFLMRGTPNPTPEGGSLDPPVRIVDVPGTDPGFSPAFADVDGDGDLDLAAAHSDVVYLWTNQGSATCNFVSPTPLFSYTEAQNLAAYDVDSDGDMDFVLAANNNHVSWIKADNVNGTEGATTWTQHTLMSGLNQPTLVSFGMVNDDAHLDMAIPEWAGERILLVWGTGPGTFDTGSPLIINSLINERAHRIILADYTGDGLTDVIVSWRADVTLHPQLGSGSFGFAPQNVTVDPAACGYSVSCIALALSQASGCAPSVTVLVPPGEYHGCFSHPDAPSYSIDGGDVTVVASAGPGTVTINCGTGGGGALFSLTSRSGRSSLSVQGIDVVGASRPFTASGDVSLALSDLSINGTSGPVVTSSEGAHVALTRVSVWDTRTTTDGGVFVIQSESSLLAVDSSMARSVSGGNGGVVAAAGLGSTARFESCTLFDNRASGAGGIGFATAGGSVELISCSVDGGSARFGALCAGTTGDSPFDYLRDSPSRLPTLPATGGGVACTTQGLTLKGEWTAEYGGLFSLCGVDVSSNGTMLAPSASIQVRTAGGILFTCRAPPSTTALPLSTRAFAPATATAATSVQVEPALLSEGLVAPGVRYGEMRATPGAQLRWVSEPPSSVMTGVALGAGVLEVLDMYGQRVVDDAVVARASVGSQSGDVTVSYTVSGPGGVTQTADSETGLDVGQYAVAAQDSVGVLAESPRVTISIAEADGLWTSFDVDLLSCPPEWGIVSGDGLPLVCGPCGADETSTETSLEPCAPLIQCPPGVLAIDQACVPCPENSERAPLTSPLFTNGSIPGVPPCICNTGSWTKSVPPVDVACIPCPPGALCRGGDAKPVSLPGFFPVDAETFAACERPGACRGDNMCNEGYLGTSCSTCAPGYYSANSLECARCPNGDKALFAAAIILFVVASLGWVVFLKWIDSSLADGISPGSRMSVPHAVSTLVVFAQILGVVGTTSRLSWPDSATRTFSLLALANWNLKLFAAECSVASFSVRFTLRTLYPALLLLICVPAIVVLRLSFIPSVIRLRSRFYVLLQKTVVTLGPLVYISVSQASCSLFDCTKEPGGDYFLDSDPSVSCFESEWFSALPVGLISLLLFTIGIPAFIMGHLLYFKDSLKDPHVIAVFGSAYSLFQSRLWFFEAVLLSKRLIVVVVTLFLSRWPFWQVGLLCIVFVSFTYLQMSVEPFYHPAHNTLDNRVSFVILVVLVCGFVFYADTFPSPSVRTLLEVILLATIVIGLIMICVALVTELRGMRESGITKHTPVTSDARMRRVWSVLAAELAECWGIVDYEGQVVVNVCKEAVSEAMIGRGGGGGGGGIGGGGGGGGFGDEGDEISLDVFAFE